MALRIVNTDQGSQFTSGAFTGLLHKRGLRISMDGKGCWRDNGFVKRPWKTMRAPLQRPLKPAEFLT